MLPRPLSYGPLQPSSSETSTSTLVSSPVAPLTLLSSSAKRFFSDLLDDQPIQKSVKRPFIQEVKEIREVPASPVIVELSASKSSENEAKEVKHEESQCVTEKLTNYQLWPKVPITPPQVPTTPPNMPTTPPPKAPTLSEVPTSSKVPTLPEVLAPPEVPTPLEIPTLFEMPTLLEVLALPKVPIPSEVLTLPMILPEHKTLRIPIESPPKYTSFVPQQNSSIDRSWHFDLKKEKEKLAMVINEDSSSSSSSDSDSSSIGSSNNSSSNGSNNNMSISSDSGLVEVSYADVLDSRINPQLPLKPDDKDATTMIMLEQSEWQDFLEQLESLETRNNTLTASLREILIEREAIDTQTRKLREDIISVASNRNSLSTFSTKVQDQITGVRLASTPDIELVNFNRTKPLPSTFSKANSSSFKAGVKAINGAKVIEEPTLQIVSSISVSVIPKVSTRKPRSLLWHPDQTSDLIATAHMDGGVRLWDVKTRALRQHIGSLQSNQLRTEAMTFLGTDYLVTVPYVNASEPQRQSLSMIALYDYCAPTLQYGIHHFPNNPHMGEISAITSVDSTNCHDRNVQLRFATAGAVDKNIFLWRVKQLRRESAEMTSQPVTQALKSGSDYRCYKINNEHTGRIQTLLMSSDGKQVYSGGLDGRICGVNLKTNQIQWSMRLGSRIQVIQLVSLPSDPNLLVLSLSSLSCQLGVIDLRTMPAPTTGRSLSASSSLVTIDTDSLPRCFVGLFGYPALTKPSRYTSSSVVSVSSAGGPSSPLFACGTAEGQVNLWDLRYVQQRYKSIAGLNRSGNGLVDLSLRSNYTNPTQTINGLHGNRAISTVRFCPWPSQAIERRLDSPYVLASLGMDYSITLTRFTL